MITVVVVAWMYRDRSLDNQKAELLAKQRAAVTKIGAEWFPLRDKLEKTVLDDAHGDFKGDFVDPETSKWDFKTAPGIFLRLRLADVKDVASIRKGADDSRRDSFVGCMFRENNPSMAAKVRGDTDAGTSGWQDQPWNLRLAYFAARVLDDDWVSEVKTAEDEIHLRVFVQQYEKSKDEEIPLAIDIIKRATFFLLLLDEDVPDAAGLAPDAGRNAGKVGENELQQVPHPVRVHLVNLKANREMVRLRREAEAGFTGEQTINDPRLLAAMKRQVNNCALAQSVTAAIAGQ